MSANPIYVLNKTVILHQAPDGFRTSMDSVMLAASCPAQSGQSLIDLGCGIGSAGLCVLKRVENTTLIGVDIQKSHIDLAARNATENNMHNRTHFDCADIRDYKGSPADHVIFNPPYLEHGKHISSPSDSKATAMGHTHDDINLQDWITCAWHHIKGQGSVSLIHDSGQTDEIIHALYSERGGKRFGGVEIFPLFPRMGVPAKRVIIRAWKHKKSPALLHGGIIMHTENGDYTTEAETILRDMKRLF